MINKVSAVPQLVIFIKMYASVHLRMRYDVSHFFLKNSFFNWIRRQWYK